jgi:ATP-dependent Clp protease ATP-binding subunit ClpC
VFERFTERSRTAMVFAQEEAGALGHDHVGTEHLLLGLVREPDGVAGRVLAKLGVTLDDVRSRAAGVRPPSEPIAGAEMPLTPRSKRVLELASEEAIEHGGADIDTEHILLGLVRGDGGPGARILRDLGVGEARVDDAVAGFSA